MIRLAVLGAGAHSQYSHGPALRAVAAAWPDVALAAVCDIDRSRAQAYADAFGFARVYQDLDAMLAQEHLDGLIAVTPVHLTTTIVSRLLPHGIPLLLEKPPGSNSAETRQLLAVAEKTGAPHMISFNRRFNPAIQQARAWLAEGGRPPHVLIARMLRVNRRETDFVTATGIHLVDAVISLLGMPAHVSATRLPAADEGVYFTQAAVAFANGSRAHLFFSPVAGSGEETYELHGEDYTILCDTVHCTLTIRERGEVVLQWSAPQDAIDAYRDGTVTETEAFINAIAKKKPYAPTLQEGLASILTAEAAATGGETRL